MWKSKAGDKMRIMEIVFADKKIGREELEKIVKSSSLGDFIKGVVDVEKGVLALGGELHVDALEVLVERGSAGPDIWGFNIYPDFSRDKRLEFISLINIRPSAGNRSMEIQNEDLKKKITAIINDLIE